MDSGALFWLLALAKYSAEALDCGFWCSSLALGSGRIFRGGAGSWLMALFSGSWIEGQVFPFKGMCLRGCTGSWIMAPILLARLTMRMRNT